MESDPIELQLLFGQVVDSKHVFHRLSTHSIFLVAWG